MGMIRRQYLPPQAEQNCTSGCSDMETEVDIGCMPTGCMPTPMAELDKGSVLEEIVHDQTPPQVTPREHGRCRRSTIGALSCASTVSGMVSDSGASSPLALESVQLSPYLAPTDPVKPAELAAALAKASVSVDCSGSRSLADTFGPQFEPKGVPTSLPENYQIYDEWAPHPRKNSVLRVRNTCVEYWEPPPLRRSVSEPTIDSDCSDWLTTLGSDGFSGASSIVSATSSVKSMVRGCTPRSCVPPPPPGAAPPPIRAALGDTPPPPLHDLEPGLMDGEPWELPPALDEFNAEAAPSLAMYVPVQCQEASQMWVVSQPPLYAESGLAQASWTASQGCSDFQSDWMGHYYVPQSQAQTPPEWMKQTDAIIPEWKEQEAAQNGDFSTYPSLEAPESQEEQYPVFHGKYEITKSRLSDAPRAGRKGGGRKGPYADEQQSYQILETARDQPGILWEAARSDAKSSKALQDALSIAADNGYHHNEWRDAVNMVWHLAYNVRQACESPHANFVISHIFETMPTWAVIDLAQELQYHAVEVAQGRFGCRCVIRLIRHHAQSGDETVSNVIMQLISAVKDLGRHQFGTHVVQELIESGLPEHRRAIVGAFQRSLLSHCKNRLSYRIVEKAFECCEPVLVSEMLDELLNHRDSLRQLTDSEFGVKVVKALLQRLPSPLDSSQRRAVAQSLIDNAWQISSRVGRSLVLDAYKIMGLPVNSESFNRST